MGVAGVPEAAGSGEGTGDPSQEARAVQASRRGGSWGGRTSGGERGAGRSRPGGAREPDRSMRGVWPGWRGSQGGIGRLGHPSLPLDSSP